MRASGRSRGPPARTGHDADRARERGISTVMDVALAMLFLSAAMLILAAYLQGGILGHDPTSADEAAETVSSTTISVEYDVENVQSESNFEPSAVEDDAAYERRRHGSIAGLAGDAAVANTSLWGNQTTVTYEHFEEAVDGATRSQLVGTETQVHVRAVWRPWANADVEGVATAGPRPSPGADVSSVTVTTPSGIRVDDTEFQSAHTNETETARLIGEAIVEHHFPPEESQRALESEGASREFVVYDYQEWAEALGVGDQFEPDTYGNFTHRETADAEAANEALAEAFEDEAYTDVPTFADLDEAHAWLSAEEVHVTVQTWSE